MNDSGTSDHDGLWVFFALCREWSRNDTKFYTGIGIIMARLKDQIRDDPFLEDAVHQIEEARLHYLELGHQMLVAKGRFLPKK